MRAPTNAPACRSDSNHIRRRGAKSFVDDLVLSRGVVLSRADLFCDLLRLSPLTRRFVRLRRTYRPARERGRGASRSCRACASDPSNGRRSVPPPGGRIGGRSADFFLQFFPRAEMPFPDFAIFRLLFRSRAEMPVSFQAGDGVAIREALEYAPLNERRSSLFCLKHYCRVLRCPFLSRRATTSQLPRRWNSAWLFHRLVYYCVPGCPLPSKRPATPPRERTFGQQILCSPS